MAVIINASTSTGLVQSADTSGQIELQTNGTTVATVNTSNNVQFRSSISVGNATPTTSGAGITFPATQSASTDANTLDDYEEGSFTPTITLGLTGITYTAQNGRYTKIGNVVTFTIRISMSSSTRNSSTLTFGNLPFTSKNIAGLNLGSVSWAYANIVTGSTTVNVPTLYIGGNLTICECYKTDGNPFIGTDLAGITPDLYIGGSYFTE